MSSRRLALIAAVSALIAHMAILARYGGAPPGPLISNAIQFLLGVGATWAAAGAARRSSNYAAKVWGLTALGLGIYTAGQGIVVYYDNVLHAQLFSPWISDQFLFFWVVPLVMAALLDRTNEHRRIDWALVLDFSQVFLVALALHLSVFALSASWQSEGKQLAYLEWQIRVVRDLIVLVALFSTIPLSSVPKTRSLFGRLTIFFFLYGFADAIYLYAEAAWQNRVGSWLDLLWTVPRVVLIYGALTWQDTAEAAPTEERHRSSRQTLPLHLASVLGPLLVAMVALRMVSGGPVMAAVLVLTSFAFSSVRFLITQDRQEFAAAELRRSRDLLKSVVEGTTEAVYVRDLEGKYVFANDAARRVLSGGDQEVVGQTNQQFLSEKSTQRSRESDLEIIQSGSPQALEEKLETNKGTHVFLSRKAPYRDATGKVIGVLGIAVDITHRRKMEEELRKAQRMESIGTLAGGVAHDFNNLLTVIKGYSQLLLDELAGTPAHEKLRQVDAAADKAATLTSQLLAFSRQQVMQPKLLNLNNIVQDMQTMLHRLIGEDIDFSVRLADDLKTILADPGRLEQVIMNLAANARDAMPRGGKLTIETSNTKFEGAKTIEQFEAPAGDYVLLTVSDTGSGMDERTQTRIFEPFFTTKPVGKGTGLGLSTVYGITKQSGGYIGVESELGRGTTFKMFFPVTDRVVHAEPPIISTVSHKQGSETILVVEDETTLSVLVETSLKKRGYRVLVANSGQEATAIAQNFDGQIDLLLTDVVMPQTSGREVADHIRALRPQTRILCMSGYTDDTIMNYGMLAHDMHFLQKPFTPTSLAAKVREVLDGV